MMKLIEKLDNLDKPLEEYKIGSSQELTPIEKELSLTVDKKGYMNFHSDFMAGNKWAIGLLLKGWAHLICLYLEDNKIVSIDIKTDSGFLTLKSRPKKNNNISNLVIYPKK